MRTAESESVYNRPHLGFVLSPRTPAPVSPARTHGPLRSERNGSALSTAGMHDRRPLSFLKKEGDWPLIVVVIEAGWACRRHDPRSERPVGVHLWTTTGLLDLAVTTIGRGFRPIHAESPT